MRAVRSVDGGVAVVDLDEPPGAGEEVEIRASGAALRYHTHFAPKGTNANFGQLRPDGLALAGIPPRAAAYCVGDASLAADGPQ